MITDDTLREGLQAPGMSYTFGEKIALAKLLSEAGIKRALVSYPSAHASEFEVAEEIVRSGLFQETYALGRTVASDIDKIYETGANISLHLPFKLERIDDVKEAIRYASKKGRRLEVAVVDVMSHSESELLNLVKMVVDAGADVVQLPDTTGRGSPAKMRSIVRQVKSAFKVEVEVHCHNDIGAAVANTVAGFEAGADHLDTTIMGIGERNGIADTASVVSVLASQGVDTGIRLDRLAKAYEYVLSLILDKIGYGFFVDNQPVFGKNTKITTAGTHAAFSDVFSAEGFSVNVYTGRSVVREILRLKGISLDEKRLSELVERVKNEAVETGRTVPAEKIVKMAEELL